MRHGAKQCYARAMSRPALPRFAPACLSRAPPSRGFAMPLPRLTWPERRWALPCAAWPPLRCALPAPVLAPLCRCTAQLCFAAASCFAYALRRLAIAPLVTVVLCRGISSPRIAMPLLRESPMRCSAMPRRRGVPHCCAPARPCPSEPKPCPAMPCRCQAMPMRLYAALCRCVAKQRPRCARRNNAGPSMR